MILSVVMTWLALAQETRPASAPAERVMTEALVVGPVIESGRAIVRRDPIEARIVAEKWTAPKEGEIVRAPDGAERTWTKVAASNGAIAVDALRGGYAFWRVDLPEAGAWVLEASGHSAVYVNGEIRGGDPYSTGTLGLPVELRAGANELLFICGRGSVSARLRRETRSAWFDTRDVMLPDLVIGEQHIGLFGAITVAVGSGQGRVSIEAQWAVAPKTDRYSTPCPIAPGSVGRATFAIPNPPKDWDARQGLVLDLVLRLAATGASRDAIQLVARVRAPHELHRRTFISEIDGSVQYYAVGARRPEDVKPDEKSKPPALVLSLHGASVEGEGQAACYAPREGYVFISPTNRRPFGFDWEDWGRLDALEVLADAQKRFATDPARVYLTGHSMGGHGTWNLGSLLAPRFAAIAPSAGWASFASYTKARAATGTDDVAAILRRAASPSDTLAFVSNLTPLGISVLHGDADDNVPVEQARAMRDALAKTHPDFTYHEQPGAGHWWGGCVDWPPFFEMFARRARPAAASVRHVDFATPNPAISADAPWCVIEQQIHCLAPSRVVLDVDPAKRRFVGKTENVMELALKLDALEPGKPIEVILDGIGPLVCPWPAGRETVQLRWEGEHWEFAPPLPLREKGPHRAGPFKAAFDHRFALVVGTAFAPEETASCAAKARYDSERWLQQGNGACEIVSDVQALLTDPDRSLILYGNRETNRAWAELLPDCPIDVTCDAVRIGTRVIQGDDLAVFFVRPRPGSDVASVGVIASTGVRGRRLAERMPIFVSGVHYPDWIVIGAEMLERGEAGIRAAGFFASNWTLEGGDAAWR